MRKQYIITIVVALVMGGALAASYQFYFKEQLEQYTADEEYCRQLEEKLNQLDQTFSKIKPERVVAEWQNALPSWSAAVQERVNYFPPVDRTKKREIDALIERRKDSEIPLYYYQDKSFRLVNQLYAEAMKRRIPIPNVGLFEAPDPFGVSQMEATAENVDAWLEWIKYGYATVLMLMDAKPQRILEVAIWPPRTESGEMLQMRTVGVSWHIRLGDLARFLNSVESSRRFAVVNAIRVQTTDLLYRSDPVLAVDLLFTEGERTDKVAEQTGPAAAGPLGVPIAMGQPMGETPSQLLGAISDTARLGRLANVEQPEVKSGFWQRLWPF